ncbi:MAG: hypothetical protein ACRCUM_02765 [Mycoplasmoidaceae bacterium]
MIYREYLEVSSIKDEFKDNFSTYYKILENRFFDFTILYDPVNLDILIEGFLLQNLNELIKGKELEKQLLDAFNRENYGSVNNMEVVSSPDESNETILSYDGEAQGEFSKSQSITKGKNLSNTSQKSFNQLEIFLSLNQLELNGIYNNLVKEFSLRFLQLCYN